MDAEPTASAAFRAREGARETTRALSRKRRLPLWALVTLSALSGLAWVVSKSLDGPQLAAEPAPPPAIPVGVATARKADFGITLAALGTVTPLATVSVKTQIAGRLTQIGFEEGQMVKEGDFLAEIDPRPYRHVLRQAQAQLTRDRALLDNARLDRERYQRLAKQNSISRQQLDTQDSLVRQYEGTVEIDEAQIEAAQLNLDYCRITAPIAGRVGLRQVDLGNYVRPSDSSVIVVLTQLQPIAVVFPIAEDRLPVVMKRMQSGTKPPVAIYDRSGRKLIAEGIVASLDSQIDPTTGTVKLKAQVDNRDLVLFPNQFVNVRLLVDTLRAVTVIPTAGVQYGPNGAFVFVVSTDDTALVRPIELGPVEGDAAAVVSGLEAGERLVVAGADRLRDGAKVRAAKE
jgi:multidrug efflux system membrane fusion protein